MNSVPGRSSGIFLMPLLILSCLFCVAAVTYAEGEKDGSKKEPTVITSRTLTADNKAKTALFEGSVVAKKGDMTLFADTMLVLYSDEKGGSNIKQIDADGNVKVIKGERVITARHATFFAEPEERMVFTGEPRASEGENVVTGTKMTYFTKDDRSLVENSKVFMVDREPKAQRKEQR